MRLVVAALFVFAPHLLQATGVICENRFPMGKKSEQVTLKITEQSDQIFSAELKIMSWDEKLIASETISDLYCHFSSTSFPAARCHYRSTDTYALTLDVISTTSVEFISPLNPLDVVSNTISATMDVVRDGKRIPYGYGEITFEAAECKKL